MTPGVKRTVEELEGDTALESEEEITQYRALAARANYLSLDRPDIAFSSKECCRHMSSPTRGDWKALRRVARYLIGHPRLVYDFPWQEASDLDVFVDTDFAGCPQTRRSTSGGCAKLGQHLIKHWSSTQKVLALSSGEAELAGILKGTSEGLGLKNLGQDLGVTVDLHVRTDSSAAVGICRRIGLGKVRHLAVGQLWIQERLRAGDFALHKHPGPENPGDLLTKHLDGPSAEAHCHRAGVRFLSGRAASAPMPTQNQGQLSRRRQT